MSIRKINFSVGSAALAAALALIFAGGVAAQTMSGSTLAPQETAPAAVTLRTTANAAPLRVMRATDFIGAHVVSSDGQKIGEIVDFVFRPQSPRLAYVVVMTGGVLGVGGESRGVPAQAVTIQNGTARVAATQAQFTALPKITGSRVQFLADPQNVAVLDRTFQIAPVADTAPGEPLLSFSALKGGSALSPVDGKLGEIDDVWFSPRYDLAPFVEIAPTLNPFQLPGNTRYAIPTARLQLAASEGRDYTFAISARDLAEAPAVKETPGVQMAADGFRGNQVLRVTVSGLAAR